jgi:hypothetical protein
VAGIYQLSQGSVLVGADRHLLRSPHVFGAVETISQSKTTDAVCAGPEGATLNLLHEHYLTTLLQAHPKVPPRFYCFIATGPTALLCRERISDPSVGNLKHSRH